MQNIEKNSNFNGNIQISTKEMQNFKLFKTVIKAQLRILKKTSKNITKWNNFHILMKFN